MRSIRAGKNYQITTRSNLLTFVIDMLPCHSPADRSLQVGRPLAEGKIHYTSVSTTTRTIISLKNSAFVLALMFRRALQWE